MKTKLGCSLKYTDQTQSSKTLGKTGTKQFGLFLKCKEEKRTSWRKEKQINWEKVTKTKGFMGMENSWYEYRYFPTFSHYLKFSFEISSRIFLKNKRFFEQKRIPKEIGNFNGIPKILKKKKPENTLFVILLSYQ